jgi:flavin reductase (DIM6/NTAB) family NADH-FMN oxidoreductase RutF
MFPSNQTAYITHLLTVLPSQVAWARDNGITMSIVTQVCFDAPVVCEYIAKVCMPETLNLDPLSIFRCSSDRQA